MNNLQKEIDHLDTLRGDNNWQDIRTPQNFKLITRTYSFGDRKCYKRITDGAYEDLQSSRGIIVDKDDIQKTLVRINATDMQLIESDKVRIDEIEQIWITLSEAGRIVNHTGFVELGFRIPRLMKHYADAYGISAWGYDISPLSIAVTKHLGFDARRYDFDVCDESLNLAGALLIVSYHMLEHVSDPAIAVKTIANAMDQGAFFHVEIPIEPGIPRLQYAHMFPFNQRDMYHMLVEAGLYVITHSTVTHSGGPFIERYMAMKI